MFAERGVVGLGFCIKVIKDRRENDKRVLARLSKYLKRNTMLNNGFEVNDYK